MLQKKLFSEVNLMSKTTLQIVQEMEQALERGEVDCSDYFHHDFDWIANFGCGTKRGLDEFERAWYKPFRNAFGVSVK